MYEDDVRPTWFFPSNIYNLVFSDKKTQIPNVSTCVFVAPKCQNKIFRFCSWYGNWHLINFEQNDSDTSLAPKL